MTDPISDTIDIALLLYFISSTNLVISRVQINFLML